MFTAVLQGLVKTQYLLCSHAFGCSSKLLCDSTSLELLSISTVGRICRQTHQQP